MAWWRSLTPVTPLFYLGWLYLVQGIPYGLQDKFIPVQLRSLGLQYSRVSLLKLLLLPWLLKGLWAPIIEVFGGRQRWLVASLLVLAAVSLTGSVIAPDDVGSVGLMLLGLNLGSAVQDVAVDGLALQVIPDHHLGLANTVQVVVYKIGSLVGGAGLTQLLDLTSWSTTFTFLASLYVFSAVWASQSHTEASTSGTSNCEKQLEYVKKSSDSSNSEFSSIKKCQLKSPSCKKQQEHINESLDLSDLDSNSAKKCQVESDEAKHQSRGANVLSILQEVFYSPGMLWLSGYVLLYKMGERGAINNMPLFFLDKGFTKQELAFWNGTVCQGLSVFGSFYGGVILAKPNISIKSVLVRHSMYRLISVISQCLVVYLLEENVLGISVSYSYIMGVASMCWLSYSSGIISTASFTLMMKMSRECSRESQASHYSVVASLEVAGKLVFASLAGFIIDHQGMVITFYIFAFLCTLPLLILTVMPDTLCFLRW